MMPTKTMLLFHFLFYRDVDWHSAALWDVPEGVYCFPFLRKRVEKQADPGKLIILPLGSIWLVMLGGWLISN